jgi:acetyl-CoA acetyltransferase
LNSYAIVGYGAAGVGHAPGRSVLELEVEAARLAITDAGVRRSKIGAAIQANSDPGGSVRTRHDDSFARVLGLPANVYIENVGRGGEFAAMALLIAMKLLDLGIAEYVVVSGAKDDWSRSRGKKATGGRGTGSLYVDKEGVWGTTSGAATAASFHSFLASRHMALYGTTSEDLGAIAVATRSWANLNPEATMYRRTMTIDDHQSSPIIVYPYHLLDFCLQSDGGIAFVVTTSDRAADSPNPVYVTGVGFGEQLSDLWWTGENYSTLAVAKARDAAFRQAGIQLTDLSFAQLYDCFTTEVLVQIEDYGWCRKGEGGAFVRERGIGPGGDLPVNTGGGLLSAYHLGNLTGLVEALRQIRGEAAGRQVPGATVGMVTGHGGEIVSGGMCAIHTTVILAKEPAR